jgi:hypothetical protein
MEEKNICIDSNAFEYPQYCLPVEIATSEYGKAKHPKGPMRFVGVDLSKQNCYVCIIDLEGKIMVHEKYSLRSTKRDKLYEMVQEENLVLMEASTGTFTIARSMNRLPGVVACVINPHTTHINETKKTDRQTRKIPFS